MHRNRLSWPLLGCALAALQSQLWAAPLGAGFVYQGRLVRSGVPVSGECSFEFSLWADPGGAAQIGATQTLLADVMNGHFAVELNSADQFGPNAFNGEERWLKIAVKAEADPAYTVLSPLQKLTASPYAQWASKGGGGGDGHSLDAADGSPLDAIFVDNAGSVGVGTTSPSPGSRLNVRTSGTYGVLGETSNTGGFGTGVHGLFGLASAATGIANGVSGQSSSAAGRGLFGWASALTGATYGVWGQSDSPSGTGVRGFASASSGETYGVRGISSSSSSNGGAAGVFGETHGTAGFVYGVIGRSNVSPDGTGVLGYASGASGGTRGLRGISESATGIGVHGQATASSGANYGVYGQTSSNAGFGGYFIGRGHFSGNLGLGTTDPATKLHISDAGDAPEIRINGDGFMNDNEVWGALSVYQSGSTLVGRTYWKGDSSGEPDFTVDTRVAADAVVVDGSSGFVGVGIASPSQRLDVAGRARIRGSGNSGGGIWLTTGAAPTTDVGFIGRGGNTENWTGIYSPAAGWALRVGDDGVTSVKVVEITGADLAEKFPSREEKVQPGTVMEIDPDHAGHLRISRSSYNSRVAGVVSGAGDLPTGAILDNLPDTRDAPAVALSGRVWTICDATGTAIQPGDLLTTSHTPGQAMKATDRERSHGAVLGKAMTALEEGKSGLVLVLVSLQ